MIHSMTGFGRCISAEEGKNITVELKSVNSRYFEFSCRVPRGYSFLEDKLKSYVQSRVSRGKVELFLSIDFSQVTGAVVSVNMNLASEYVKALRELSTALDIPSDISSVSLSRIPDILTVSAIEIDEEALWNQVKSVTEKAVDAFITMRETEGEKLKNDILNRADIILNSVAFIEERSPQTVSDYRQKLEARIKDLLADAKVDEQRLLTETAIFADKIAVDEETVRLRSHIDQLSQLISSDEPVGRKLDFLVQEINRETNTIGSKTQNLEISKKVVDMKAEIEKIREQVQNIE